MSLSVSSSSLNSLGIIRSPSTFFHVHSTQWLSLIRPAMPSMVRCENVLAPTCSVLGTYSERPQSCQPTAIHRFKVYVTLIPQGNIFMTRFYSIPNLLCMFMVLITDALHIKPAVKCIFQL